MKLYLSEDEPQFPFLVIPGSAEQYGNFIAYTGLRKGDDFMTKKRLVALILGLVMMCAITMGAFAASTTVTIKKGQSSVVSGKLSGNNAQWTVTNYSSSVEVMQGYGDAGRSNIPFTVHRIPPPFSFHTNPTQNIVKNHNKSPCFFDLFC